MRSELLNRNVSTRARLVAPPTALAFAAAGALARPRASRARQSSSIRLTGWTSSPAEQELFESILADAQTATGVTINYEPIPSDFFTKLQTDIAAGTVADIFYLDSMPAPDLMASGQVLALDDLMADSGVSAADFYPGLIESFQFNGQTYGLPKDWSSLAMVTNSAALEAAGVDSPPTTWDELRAAGEALAESAGEPRIMIPADIARYLAFHYAAGAGVFSEDGSEVAFNTPEAEEALSFYYGLYADEIATTPADAGAQWPGDGFAKEFADIVFEGNWVFPFLQDNAPDLEYAISEMPAGPAGQASLAFTVSFSIFEGTEDPEAAWEVVNYLTGPEGMGAWTSLGLAMPARTGLADEWVAEFPEREPFLASGDYAQGWQLGVGGNAFVNDANAEMQGLFADTQDVTTTLERIQAAAEDRIQI